MLLKTLRAVIWFICLTSPAWFLGCSKSGDPGKTSGDAASEKTKLCFHCIGTGKVPCPNGKDGLMACPGPCLKLSQGTWEHMEVAGHPPSDIWQKFSTANGGWQAWNQNHVGDVIEYRNGDPVNLGKCKVCAGTGRVKCTLCGGTGLVDCPVCEGKKVVPGSWTEFNNPKMKNRPDQIKLKDGRVLVGKKIMILGDSVTIRTETTNVVVKSSDIVAEEKPAP